MLPRGAATGDVPSSALVKTEKKHYLFFVLQKEGLSTCAALLKMGGRGGGEGEVQHR